MLQFLPRWLGQALSTVRAGRDGLTIVALDLGDVATMTLTSPAFADGARMPDRFTADGEGVSPPLVWSAAPPGTVSLALIVEDADAPTPNPLVHAIVAGIEPALCGLDEGAIGPDGDGDANGDTGRNSFLSQGWLPPDPPSGHGAHSYVFQLFALSDGPAIDPSPGRGALREALTGRVIGAAVLTGTYSRDEEAPVGPTGAAVPA